MFKSIHEECGVFGIYTNKPTDVATSAYFALYALQHRGQESCGIVVNERGVFKTHKGLGLVNEVFTQRVLSEFEESRIAIGHVRYSTTGNVNTANCQPMTVRHIKGALAIAHNGNLINALDLRKEFEMNGAIFHSTSDTEVISYAITRERLESHSIQEALEKAMYKIKGAYSLVLMSPKKLIAARDPHGFRPLCLGELPDGEGYVVASESCAFDSIGARFVRDIKPGEIVVIDENGVESIETHCGQKSSLCVFEFVYFARPDSVIEGASVHNARLRAGHFLAKEHPVEADVVIGCPDSGLDAALGFSQASGIPYGVGFIKNRYIGRTFIQPTQGMRDNAVKIKLNVIRETVEGKRVVLVDDSIVRGTTSAKVVKLLRNAGAKEIHMRISAPPFISECYFGTDIDSKENLIANKHTVEEIAQIIGVDSLGFLSTDGVISIAENAGCEFCRGCFTGEYPIEVPKEFPKDKFEMKFDEDLDGGQLKLES
ncbi:MAG: amidophosphoribosyltransferase [Oscillospiraceae bacterium]|nr:amidophosphoribosyltransferase [Oscillospiraceae bacterium]